MGKDVEKILQELYQIDENLKQNESELTKIIQNMLLLKPNIKMDENFKLALKERISEKITSEKLQNYMSRHKLNIWQIFSYIFWTAWIAAFSFFIFGETFAPHLTSENKTTQVSDMLSFENFIVETNTDFWNLKSLWVNKWALGSWQEKMSLKSSGVVEDMMVESSSLMMDVQESPWMVEGTDMRILPIDTDFIPEVYRYHFSWALNIDIPETLPIYKKSRVADLWKNFVEKFWNFSFNGLDISRFSDLSAGNISLNQEKKYGYSINIDFSNGYLNIYKNWDKWPQKNYDENKQIDLLSDDELLQIANNFMKEYKIDVSQYWAAQIDTNYDSILREFSTSKKAPSYIPESTYIIYPSLLNGKEIITESGEKIWVKVEVDIQEKKVSSVLGLKIDQYAKSDYKIENNTENILYIANAWWRFWLETEKVENAQYIDIELKNPRLQYIHTYNYTQNNWQEDFLIPAIVFEIESSDKTNFMSKIISVPLLKDFYSYDENGNIVWNSQE